MRVTPVLRPEVLLHPPHPFVTSRVVWSICVTCYVSTCCNNNTLVFVSLRVSKFRFLGCIFSGAVLCIYYANEFSFFTAFPIFFLIRPILFLFLSFTAFSFFSCSFLALLFVPICFVISFLIPLLCYFVYGLNDSLFNVPR